MILPTILMNILIKKLAINKLIDEIDQNLIELLLKGYSNKKIALDTMSPLSTVQRRIRKIFENKYVQKKNELNHKRLVLRKCYLSISP